MQPNKRVYQLLRMPVLNFLRDLLAKVGEKSKEAQKDQNSGDASDSASDNDDDDDEGSDDDDDNEDGNEKEDIVSRPDDAGSHCSAVRCLLSRLLLSFHHSDIIRVVSSLLALPSLSSKALKRGLGGVVVVDAAIGAYGRDSRLAHYFTVAATLDISLTSHCL